MMRREPRGLEGVLGCRGAGGCVVTDRDLVDSVGQCKVNQVMPITVTKGME